MRTAGGELTCFDCGKTSHLRNECPIYLSKVGKFGNPDGGGGVVKKEFIMKEERNGDGNGTDVRCPCLPDDEVRNTGIAKTPKMGAMAKIMLILRES